MGRLVIVRFVAALVALVVTWFGVPEPASASTLPSTAVAFDYDGHHLPNATTPSTTERGPPTNYDYAQYDSAVDHGSNRALARPSGIAAAPTTTDTVRAAREQPVEATATTRGNAEVADGDLSSLQRTRVAANGAAQGDHIVLGLRDFGLKDTASKVGGRTLLKDDDWMSSLRAAIDDPSTKFTVSLDGMSGSSTYAQVMNAVQRGAGAGTKGWATDWEMLQLHEAGRLPGVTFMRGGSVVENPWAP